MALIFRTKLLMAALFFSALAVLYWFSLSVAALSMDILFPLAPGMSFWKTGLFLIWIAAFLWFFALCPLISSAPLSFLAASIILVQGINILMQLWFAREFGISVDDYATFINGGALSTTEMTHTHVMKVVVAEILRVFGIAGLKNADAGVPFLSVFPSALNWLMLLLIAGVLILLIRSLGAAFALVPEKVRGVWLCLTLLSSYAVFKSLIDGGPLTLEFILGSLVLTRAVTAPAKPLLPLAMILAVIFCALAVGALAGEDLETSSTIPRILFLLVAVPGLIDYVQRRSLVSLGKAVIVSTLAAGQLAETAASGHYAVARTAVPPGSRVYVTSRIEMPPEYEAIMREPPFTVYRTIAKEGDTLGDFVKAARTAPKYRQLLVHGMTCDDQALRFITGEIMTAERPKLPPRFDSEIFPEFYVELCQPDEPCAYRYSGKMRDCVAHPNAKPVIARHLINAGFSRFVLVRSLT